ncbi:zinc metalloproteinase-disintegrin-like EoMP06 [Hydractinia symbiolongicarpus]|uniref:zinc metalloproteinase-disintegrin-like EoMP06 n=1 Tax=Hydractinia symbiolongicarpus TaxID=13093 RepID=UPI00254AFFBF|nr:zinc metalloproteinase-disintegrin-like EoMP06 [Hydractinia symbiolongicarpus]
MLLICRCVYAFLISLQIVAALSYEDEVTTYEIVEPIHLGSLSRNRRDLSTRTGEKENHLDSTKFEINGFHKHFTLHLHKNRYLLPSSFVVISQLDDGTDHIEKGIEHCYYHGHLGNPEETAVAVDTCNGLKGIIQDETGEEYFIEPHVLHNKNYEYHNKHVLYKTKDLKIKKQGMCGHNHTGDEYHNELNFLFNSKKKSPLFSDHFRKRRATENKKYIEVIVVLDKRSYNKRGTVQATITRGVEVMNFVDLVYKTMNTRIALTGVIVWNVVDKIHVTEKAGDTLGEFRKYSVDVIHGSLNLNPDNIQLLSGIDFEGSLVGLAGIGVICSEGSCAVNQDHANSAAVLANTVAHEMGHNLGFYHNGGDCKCSKTPCVMGAYAPSTQVKGFSSCVHETYDKKLDKGSIPCVFDYPEKLYGDPKCGNGFLEEGEACDCGTPEECKASGADACCLPKTCKLQSTAQCATGPCCEKCKFKSKGTLCRDKFNKECDLQEYCTGKSNECPKNFYVKDGVSCSGNTAYCFKGTCESLDTQCQTLWGPNAVKAHDVCFKQNAKSANEWGNCGKNNRGEFIPCAEADILCGKMQCAGKSKDHPLPTFPIIGSSRKRNKIVFTYGGGSIVCIMGVTSLGDDLDDPTITPDGTKCADNAICMDQKCVNISSLKHIKSCSVGTCLNGGVCNNNGHCHCPPGYACPTCQFAGPGGSLDSGQGCISGGGNKGDKKEGLEDCGCLTPLVKGMLILFLLVIPLCALIGYLCYRNRVVMHKRYQAYRTKSDRGRSASSKELRHGRPSRDAGIDNTYEAPYVTYSDPNARPQKTAAKPSLKPPQSSPAPPPPRTTPVTSSSSKTENKLQFQPIGGRSPKVARLPPIENNNKFNFSADVTSGKKWPPPPTYKPYK